MEVTELVANKLRKYADIDDTDIAMGIEEAKQVILNYCNISSVPEALNFTHAMMAVDTILFQFESNRSPDAVTDEEMKASGAITSIKEGDTTISFSSSSGPENQRAKTLVSHKSNLDALMFNYKAQLQGFRRIV